MYDAFISYAREDLSFIESLKRGLDAERLRVFVDLHSLRAGLEWPPQLGAALGESRMMVLCWSARAGASNWVDAEINVCLITQKPVLPWLLDNTPLPAKLSRTHGMQGADPVPIVRAIAHERWRSERRRIAKLAPAGALLALAPWLAWRLYRDRMVTLHGHIIDQTGHPLVGAAVEAEGIRYLTGADGDFRLVLPGPPGRELRVSVRKAGFVSREIDMRSDVPDFGVVLEKER